MCSEEVRRKPYTLDYVPDHFKTQEMCNKAVPNYQAVLFLVPDHFKTQEICIKAVEIDLYHIPNHFKTHEICNNGVWKDLNFLQYVSDWFVSCHQTDLWGDNNDCYDDDKLIEWYEGYQKRNAQKVKIKKELLPIA